MRTLKAPKVLPNYRFLSQGHRGMRSKMDYVPTFTPSFSLFLSPLFLQFFPLYYTQSPSISFSLFNGLHMSAKWLWYCCDKVKSVPVLHLMLLDHSVLLTVHKPDPPVQTARSGSLFVSSNCCLLISVREKKRRNFGISNSHFFTSRDKTLYLERTELTF